MTDRQESMDHKKAALDEITRLSKKNGGTVTPEEIIDAARDKNSPLHEYFDWNDKEAAEKYRLTQARGLIRACRFKTKVTNRRVELPYYVRDPEAGKATQGYVEIEQLRTKKDLHRDVVLDECKRARTALARAIKISKYLGVTEEVTALVKEIEAIEIRLLEPNPHEPAPLNS